MLEVMVINKPEFSVLFVDVDGTMTDGGMYWGFFGLLFKKFNTRDAIAMHRLEKLNIRVVFVSGSSDRLTKRRLKRIGAKEIYLGIWEKHKWLKEFMTIEGIQKDEAVYIGDDYNDIRAMALCGTVICPFDATDGVQDIADYICDKKGGEGVLSEATDILLGWDEEVESFYAIRDQ